MKKIYYASIEGPEYSRHTGEIMEAEHGEEWDGDVAAYLDNIDAEYIEGPQHIPGDVQQHFTASPANICVELNEGTPACIWWTDEEDEEGIPHADPLSAYEITETAYALMGGGWTADDEAIFAEEDAKQDRPLDPDDIPRIFAEIRRIERDTAPADQGQVVTKYGIKVNFDTAVNLMDDDLREAIHATGEYDDDPQGFFEAYAAAHLAKFRQPWELGKPHPIY